jgi:hypothetical protein
MPVSMTALADDLAAESAVLRGMVAGLDAAGWARETPAEGWTIADSGVTRLVVPPGDVERLKTLLGGGGPEILTTGPCRAPAAAS